MGHMSSNLGRGALCGAGGGADLEGGSSPILAIANRGLQLLIVHILYKA